MAITENPTDPRPYLNPNNGERTAFPHAVSEYQPRTQEQIAADEASYEAAQETYDAGRVAATPTFLAVETREGRANLAGKRRLVDDFDEAVEVADEIDGQVFALEPVEAAPFQPVPAVRHVQLSGDPFDSPLDVA